MAFKQAGLLGRWATTQRAFRAHIPLATMRHQESMEGGEQERGF